MNIIEAFKLVKEEGGWADVEGFKLKLDRSGLIVHRDDSEFHPSIEDILYEEWEYYPPSK